jgi:hypothetical protein
MKVYFCCLLAGVAFLAACQKKETTVTNPPAENKTESNATFLDQSITPSNNTETNPAGGNKTETNTTVVNQSPVPSSSNAETNLPAQNKTESNTSSVNQTPVPLIRTERYIPEENRTVVTYSTPSALDNTAPNTGVNPFREPDSEIMERSGAPVRSPTP